MQINSSPIRVKNFVVYLTLQSLLVINVSLAQTATQSPLLTDANGDSIVQTMAIGDSLTAGIGAGIPEGQTVDDLTGVPHGRAYPERLSSLIGIPCENEGIPGEEWTTQGVYRVPGEVSSGRADTVILFEGLNDAGRQYSVTDFRRAYQRAVNVTKSLGVRPLLVTLPRPCCNHAGLVPFVAEFNRVLHTIAEENDVALADVGEAWETTCRDIENCQLLNLPEGLHPNTRGQDAITQTIAATLLGIDIFAPDGATQFAMATGTDPGSVLIKPIPVAVPAPVAPAT